MNEIQVVLEVKYEHLFHGAWNRHKNETNSNVRAHSILMTHIFEGSASRGVNAGMPYDRNH